MASANCGRYCGADVDFVDIEPSTGLMSVTALEQKLQRAERNGTLPKVVVPVHLTGSSCNMAVIASLAERYGFSVLEDASHAIGGRYCGESVGNCRHSAITVFSFHPVKIITTGEGGLATTNDPLLFQRMSDCVVMESFAILRLPAASSWSWVYEQQELGNYRMRTLSSTRPQPVRTS